jgi:hypothetical protein
MQPILKAVAKSALETSQDRWASAGPYSDAASKLQSMAIGDHCPCWHIWMSVSSAPHEPYAHTRPSCVHAVPRRGRGLGQSGAGSWQDQVGVAEPVGEVHPHRPWG